MGTAILLTRIYSVCYTCCLSWLFCWRTICCWCLCCCSHCSCCWGLSPGGMWPRITATADCCLSPPPLTTNVLAAVCCCCCCCCCWTTCLCCCCCLYNKLESVQCRLLSIIKPAHSSNIERAIRMVDVQINLKLKQGVSTKNSRAVYIFTQK